MSTLLEKIEEIVTLNKVSLNENSNYNSLLGGELIGTILFQIEYLRIKKTVNVKDSFLLKKKIEQLLSANLENGIVTYCNGISGYAWFINYLIKNEYLEIDASNFFKEIDNIVYKFSLKQLEVGNHDFLHGAVGNMVYLLERKSSNKVLKYIENLLIKLREQAIQTKEGLFWEDSFEENEKSINIGLSHGLSGKIVLFSKLYKSNICKSLVKEMLVESVRFILNNKNVNQSDFSFPDRLNLVNKEKNVNSGLRWCYGDMGISIALWQAGEVLQDDVIKKEAIDICIKTTKFKGLEETKILDAGMCHGTAGVAYIYNKMYKYSGQTVFQSAANYWLNITLEKAIHKDGLAGYKKYYAGTNSWYNDYGLLEGTAGIGLTLLSFLNEESFSWDRCLLLS